MRPQQQEQAHVDGLARLPLRGEESGQGIQRHPVGDDVFAVHAAAWPDFHQPPRTDQLEAFADHAGGGVELAAIFQRGGAVASFFLQFAPGGGQGIFARRAVIIADQPGGQLKARKEIRIASLFRETPPEFLHMIAVHELAHLRELSHNKAFYQLCEHMLPGYGQMEFDLRLWLTWRNA